tara:strand:+ start:100 stop:342 length:243 start_codon:yes stop_codon:yes gene_type:complete
MKELIILITVFFAEPNIYPNAVSVDSRYGKPLRFSTQQECAEHIDKNLETLEEFAMAMFPEAVRVRDIFCVEKQKGFTGV